MPATYVTLTTKPTRRRRWRWRPLLRRNVPQSDLPAQLARGNDAAWKAEAREAARRYWNAHPIAVDRTGLERASPECFDRIFAHMRSEYAETNETLLAACRGRRVLEVGCGIGIAGRYLAEKGVDYTGLDRSTASIALARTHFAQHALPGRFVVGDAVSLPFPDGAFETVFSLGVLHHVPDMALACREVERVTAPGGTVRVMLYNRASYVYALVSFVVVPLVWLLLRLPAALARRLVPFDKLRNLYEISRDHGFSRERILAASTDTSSTGAGNANPLSYVVTEDEVRRLFPCLQFTEARREALKYFPVRALHGFVARRWGFFLTMTAVKRSESGRPADG